MPSEPTMTVDEFVAKWRKVSARETQAAQSHFIDLCAVIGVENPVEADPEGDSYAFEKGVKRPDGSMGQADVRKQDRFGWEYKGKNKDLTAAYEQLLGYREGLGNPPLLVVCDMNRFEIHTNFTNTEPRVIRFDLKDLSQNPSHFSKILRDVFLDPNALHPTNDPRYITETAAAKFGEVAEALRDLGHDPAVVARFLNRLIFSFFAESIGLFRGDLGEGFTPVSDTLRNLGRHPERSKPQLAAVFAAMSDSEIPAFGPIPVPWFNGGLFDQAASAETFELTADLVGILLETSELDWSRIDPAIFGTLFERGLDPSRRSQLGAHYTDPDNITRVVEPVVLRPLRREFEQLKSELTASQSVSEAALPAYGGNGQLNLDEPDPESPEGRIRAFHQRLIDVRVLDPACGSGNFLYVAMRELMQLEQNVIDWARTSHGMNRLQRQVGPSNMLGIDIDQFAVDLTRLSLWIGHLQWLLDQARQNLSEPILGHAEQIECRNAVLTMDGAGNPVPAEWPEANFIVGNPPFLGMKRMRQELPEREVDRLRAAYADDLDGRVDLCVYWHELARRQIRNGKSRRAGLLATQNIRGAFSRPVLERINESGAIFFAYPDEEWINDGAAVRISIIGQDDGSESECTLDGASVSRINPDLTTGSTYVASAKELKEQERVAFQGDIRNGPFDLTDDQGQGMLAQPVNVNGRPNSDVVFPFVNAHDLAQRPRGAYIIDFGQDIDRRNAAQYEEPWEYARSHIQPYRETLENENLKSRWWIHESWRPGMRAAIKPLIRYIATPITSKHRFYVWLEASVIPDATVVAIARDDDYAFGVLHSRIHEIWALAQGTRLADGSRRYPHSQCLNTFPFPWPLNTAESILGESQIAHRTAIAAAAKTLDERREAWLNPAGVNPTILQDRTMTSLYNRRPDWLDDAHEALDHAVFAAYGWSADMSDDDILTQLLKLNGERAAASS